MSRIPRSRSRTVSTESQIHEGREETEPFRIRQNPRQARMTGFSEHCSTRVLDPPLVVEVFPALLFDSQDFIEKQVRSGEIIQRESEIRNLICTTTLYHHEDGEELSVCSFARVLAKFHNVDNTRAYQVLLGQTIKNCVIIPRDDTNNADPDNSRYFFVFNDLGVRIQGCYKLRCTIMLPRYLAHQTQASI